MFKKLLAVVAAIAIGAGLATVAVAAPATASHPVLGVQVDCAADGSYIVTWSVQNSEPEPEYEAVIVASSRPGVVPVGAVLSGPDPLTFTESFDSPEAVSLSVTARWPIWGIEKTETLPLVASTLLNCANPPSFGGGCTWVNANAGRPLALGDAVTVQLRRDGAPVVITGSVVAGGGYNGLAILNDLSGATTPLDRESVLLGQFDFDYGSSLPFNVYSFISASGFGRSETTTFDCGSVQTLKVSAEPTVAPPTCDADGSLVITEQSHIVFTVTPTFSGPGTYTVTAAVDDPIDYVLEGPSEWKDLVVEPQLVGWDCEEQAVPVVPDVTSIEACDQDGSITFQNTPGVLYELIEGDGIQGAWKVRATPLPGYHFGTQPSDPQVQEFSGDLGVKTTCVTPVPPKPTSQSCDTTNGGVTGAFVHIPHTDGIIYSIGGVDIVGPVDYPVQPGTVRVDVRVSSDQYVLIGDDFFEFPITEAKDCDEGLTITALAFGEPETCDTTTGQYGDGDVVIPHTDHVSYAIDGTPVDTSGTGDHRFPYPKGSYVVTATAEAGWIIVGAKDFPITVDEYPFACEQDRTPVTASASAVAERCTTAGSVAPGRVTVAFVPGVSYTLTTISGGAGTAKAVGAATTVALTAANTIVPAGTYLVTATADPGYVIQGPDSWTLTVGGVDAESCGTQLAFTGAAPAGLIAAALTLMGVGGVLILVRRIRRREATATPAD